MVATPFALFITVTLRAVPAGFRLAEAVVAPDSSVMVRPAQLVSVAVFPLLDEVCSTRELEGTGADPPW